MWTMIGGAVVLFLLCAAVGSFIAFLMLGTSVWKPNSGLDSAVEANTRALARIESCINVANGTGVTVTCITTVEEDANFQGGFCSGESCDSAKKRNVNAGSLFQVGIDSVFSEPTSATDITSDLLHVTNITVTNSATISFLNVTTLFASIVEFVDLIVESMTIARAFIGDLAVTNALYLAINQTSYNINSLLYVWNVTAQCSILRRTITDFIPFTNDGYNSTILSFSDLNDPFFYGANYDPWGIFDISTPYYVTLNQNAFISVQAMLYFASNYSNTQAMCSVYLNSSYQVIIDPIPPLALGVSTLFNVTGTPQGDFFPFVGVITLGASGYALAGSQITMRCLCPVGEVFAFTPSSSISISTMAVDPPANPTESGIIVPSWPFAP